MTGVQTCALPILEQLSIPDTILILKGLRDRYEAHHQVSISDEALAAAAQLSARYVQDRFLPDKGIDLIDEAGARSRLRTLEYKLTKSKNIPP